MRSTMLKRRPLMAEILFYDPADVKHGSAALSQRGFEIKIMRVKDEDEEGPTGSWVSAGIQATLVTEVDIDGFKCLVDGIVQPLGGDVLEWGHPHLS